MILKMDDLKKENEELKEIVKKLKQHNALLRKKLERYEQEAIRRYRHDMDYLPYEDDDRR
ncbi:MAG: hypothetical protein DWQ19_10125 [Crenarchaeota archaeon]|nr:MAG: hypothetical protein DWQ19_10125 [Thermoproteota archaeon]